MGVVLLMGLLLLVMAVQLMLQRDWTGLALFFITLLLIFGTGPHGGSS